MDLLTSAKDFYANATTFSGNNPRHTAESFKCAFMLSLLMGKALDWASAVWDSDTQIKRSANYFASQIKEVFEYPARGKDVLVQLLELRQGSDSATDYTIKLSHWRLNLAAQSGWNAPSLMAFFCKGLNADLKADMACKEMNVSLSLSTLLLDNVHRQHQPASSFKKHLSLEDHETDGSESMQLRWARVSTEERECRVQQRLCFYCGKPGHCVYECQERPTTAKVETCTVSCKVSFPVCISHTDTCFHATVLIDSGAAVNLIDRPWS